ncbi:hypothetical protein [Gemmata sp.]|uniref:hypothetical protein n=1 Tax=Gemmata sp. TaxID=1914242 RepID=UPI003F709616
MTPYIAIDIETTGLDPRKCQILEVAAVAESRDWSVPVNRLPSVRFLVEHKKYRGEPFGLAMNARLLFELAKPKAERLVESVWAHEVACRIAAFSALHVAGTPTLAGKNFGMFDFRFLERLKNWHEHCRFRHRVLDPGSMFLDPLADDRVPDTGECMKRAGVTNDHPHSALHDCYAVIEMVRAHYRARAQAGAA